MKLLLFDLDNTLVDRAGTFLRWAKEFGEAHGVDPGWLLAAEGDGFVPRLEFFAAVRERFALAAPVETLVAQYRARMAQLVNPRPEVVRGLADLRDAGWSLGIVSNGEPVLQLPKLRAAGLDDVVDGWAISGAEGFRKPDVELFRIAAGRCGARLEAGGWMVGDTPEADIVGGHRAGLRTGWIRRGRVWGDDDVVPDLVADDVVVMMTKLLEV